MYTGKSSRNPNLPLIWGLIIALGLIAFGMYLYFDLAAWESTTEEKRLNAIIWALYDFGGKRTVAGFFAICGLFAAFSGYKKTAELRKLKNEAKQ